MKTKFKIGFLLLSICMILVMTSIMGVFAAEANISMDVSHSEVKVGDTFTIVISNADLNAAGFGVVLDYSAQKDLIECTDVTGVDDDEYFGMYYSGKKGAVTWIDANVGNDAENTNSDGIFSFGVVTGKATDFFEGKVATLTFTAKTAGTVIFTLTERTSGTDAYDGVVETFTLTITDEPASDCDFNNPHAITLPYISEDLAIESEEEWDHYYVWTAPANGQLTIVVPVALQCDAFVNGDIIADGEGTTLTLNVQKDDVVILNVYNLSDVNGKWSVSFCDHSDTTQYSYDSNGDDTHTVICSCGEVVNASENCSGGTATCTEKATCSACGEKYGLEADHSFLNGIRGAQLTPGNCNISATYATKCDNCDYEDATKVITGEKDPSVHYQNGTLGYYKNNGDGTHSFICGPCGQPVAGTTGEHDRNGAVKQPGNCLYPSVIACSVCKADITYTTVPDVHAAIATNCIDNKDGTHTVKWPCCGDVVDAKAAHDYTTGTSAHTCNCGAVETFKLTVLDYLSEQTVIGEFDVPFNDNLMAYLSQLTPADIPYPGAGDPNGYLSFNGDYLHKDDSRHVETNDKMPGNDIVIFAYYTYTGWSQCGDIDGINQYCYTIKDEVLTGWQYIEGSWYYLNPDLINGYYGLRAYGFTRVPYPTEAINGVTYAPNADDLAYWEAHKDTSKYSDATTALFYFDEDGKFVQYTGLEGKSYFINGMAPWHVGFVQIGEDFYYFGGDKVNGGNVMLTGKVYASRDYNSGKAVGAGKIYYFAEDGKLIEGTDGIVEMADGYYYFIGGKLASGAGVVKMTDEAGKTFYIYVRSNGQLATGIYWPTTLNGELERGAYNWGTDGKYYPDVQEKEIREVDGVYYYYVNGIKKPGAGVVDMVDENGVTYYIYVRSNGQLATGEYWPTTRNDLLPRGKYDWGKDGKYYPAAE